MRKLVLIGLAAALLALSLGVGAVAAAGTPNFHACEGFGGAGLVNAQDRSGGRVDCGA